MEKDDILGEFVAFVVAIFLAMLICGAGIAIEKLQLDNKALHNEVNELHQQAADLKQYVDQRTELKALEDAYVEYLKGKPLYGERK